MTRPLGAAAGAREVLQRVLHPGLRGGAPAREAVNKNWAYEMIRDRLARRSGRWPGRPRHRAGRARLDLARLRRRFHDFLTFHL